MEKEQRQMHLLCMLLNAWRHTVPISEIQGTLGISDSTMFRDLRALRFAGADIIAHGDGYFLLNCEEVEPGCHRLVRALDEIECVLSRDGLTEGALADA